MTEASASVCLILATALHTRFLDIIKDKTLCLKMF